MVFDKAVMSNYKSDLSNLSGVDAGRVPIRIKSCAASKILSLINNRIKNSLPTLGIRIKMSRKGCGGNQYSMEYVNIANKEDEIFEIDSEFGSIKIFVDRLCLFKVIGTTIDYVENEFEKSFSLKHEKEKGRCGCEKSFYY